MAAELKQLEASASLQVSFLCYVSLYAFNTGWIVNLDKYLYFSQAGYLLRYLSFDFETPDNSNVTTSVTGLYIPRLVAE